MRLARGITATTHVDRHRDKLTLGALEDMVRQIEDHYIPVLNQGDYKEECTIPFREFTHRHYKH